MADRACVKRLPDQVRGYFNGRFRVWGNADGKAPAERIYAFSKAPEKESTPLSRMNGTNMSGARPVIIPPRIRSESGTASFSSVVLLYLPLCVTSIRSTVER